jgi:hypothetical protein
MAAFVLAPADFEPVPADVLAALHRRVGRYRCGCGRFVPAGSVVVTPHHEYGYGSEQDTTGDCRACGPGVGVGWDE